jgi:hypothetical protein
MNEKKLARICWNTNNWQKPSGKEGKSRNRNTSETIVNYGHEEWLFDFEKIIDGYHYSFLPEIGNNRKKYEGKKIDISFFSINNNTNQWWWIGEVKNVIVISKKESKEVFREYKRRDWFDEMIKQLKEVDADDQYLGEFSEFFAKIKFKVQDVHLLDPPVQIKSNDPAVPSHRYVLMNFVKPPKLPLSTKFLFKSGHSSKGEKTFAKYGAHKKTIDLFHNRIQKNIYQHLSKIYGKQNVGTECEVNRDSKVDIVVKQGSSFNFYEIKTSNSLLLCIREAIAQLLEYSYFPNTRKAKKLIIVSHNRISSEAGKYLKHLRSSSSIPIYYQHFDHEKNVLDSTLY